MNTPTIRNMEHLQNWDTKSETKTGWVCARPYGYQGLMIWYRLKCAWLVFTGKCDVLEWHDEA